MNCNRCGYRIPNGMNQCPNCGNYVYNQMYNGQKPTCGLATASMVFGILSLFCFGLLFAIPAVILGFSAKKKIAAENLGGEGQATAGIVTGFITIVLFVFALVLLIVSPAVFEA